MIEIELVRVTKFRPCLLTLHHNSIDDRLRHGQVQSALAIIQAHLYDALTIAWQICLHRIPVILGCTEDRACKVKESVDLAPFWVLRIFRLWKIDSIIPLKRGMSSSR